jgi:hypothetical protein
MWAYFCNKNNGDTKLTFAVRSMGRGRRVGQGDLATMDYLWRCGAANPMVMVLSSSEDFG